MEKSGILDVLIDSIHELEVVIKSGTMDENFLIYKVHNDLKVLYNNLEKEVEKIEINDEIFSNMINEAIHLKIDNPNSRANDIAEQVIDKFVKNLNLSVSENKINELLFQLSFAIINNAR